MELHQVTLGLSATVMDIVNKQNQRCKGLMWMEVIVLETVTV